MMTIQEMQAKAKRHDLLAKQNSGRPEAEDHLRERDALLAEIERAKQEAESALSPEQSTLPPDDATTAQADTAAMKPPVPTDIVIEAASVEAPLTLAREESAELSPAQCDPHPLLVPTSERLTNSNHREKAVSNEAASQDEAVRLGVESPPTQPERPRPMVEEPRLDPKTDDMIRHLRWLHTGREPRWVLAKINPDARQGTRSTTAAAIADDDAAPAKLHDGNAAGFNMYFCAGTPTPSWHGPNPPTKDEIESCAILVFDRDCKPGLTVEDILADLKVKVDAGTIPEPGATIMTGGGVQCQWRLRQPLKPEEAEAKNRWIAKTLDGDKVWNRNRLMRIAGGLNWPNKQKRERGRGLAEGYVIDLRDDLWSDADDFGSALEESAFDKNDRNQSGFNAKESYDGITPNDERLKALDAKWLALGRDGDFAGDYNKDGKHRRSGALFAFAIACAKAGIPEDVVAAIITDPEWKISAPILEKRSDQRKREVERTIERARQLVADDPDRAPILGRRTWTANMEKFKTRYCEDIAFHAGDYLTWDGSAYLEVERDEVKSWAQAFLDSALVIVDKDKENTPTYENFNPAKHDIEELLGALQNGAYKSRDGMAPPCWLDGDEGRPPARECISLRNGILHAPTRKLMPATPDFFTRCALTFDHDPEGKCETWLSTLEQYWPRKQDGSPADEVLLLQEVFGYLVMLDTRLHVFFLLLGPTRSGKGTITRVLTKLIGDSNITTPRVGDLGERFGLDDFPGKSVAIVNEFTFGRQDDRGKITNILKSIVGEDDVNVERKFKGKHKMRLPVRFVFVGNKTPEFVEDAGAIGARLVALRTTRSFEGVEDRQLDEKLAKELPGILNWALDGYARLTGKAKDHFTETAAGTETKKTIERLASPVRAFVQDRCAMEARKGDPVTEQQMYQAYVVWCLANNTRAMGTTKFTDTVLEAFPTVRKKRGLVERPGGRPLRPEYLLGIRLLGKDEAPPMQSPQEDMWTVNEVPF